jgi:hypothetical protein
MDGLIQFMASMSGRLVRAIAGIVLVVVGLFVVEGTVGAIIAIIGLVPLAAGALDFCIIAPLLGFPFSGKAIRGGGR